MAARLPDGDRLLVVCHHLIADGQSVSILTDRIIDLARGTREITASRTDQGLFTYQNGQLSRPSPETLARRESFWSENLPRHRIPQLDHWLLASPHEDAAREFRLTVPRDAAEAVREGVILPGRGNRSSETATGYTPAARNLATKGAL